MNFTFKFNLLFQINAANDWLGFIDQVNQRILRSQDYSMMGYIPYLMVTFHLHFAASNIPKIQYPQSAYEVGLIE
jgi:hypothetical protein